MRWFSLVLALGLAATAWGLSVQQPPQIAIENRSGVAIESFELQIGSSEARFDPLGAGELTRQILPIEEEGPVQLRIRFAGGLQRQFDAGWFSPGQAGTPRWVLESVDSLRVVHD